MSDMPLAVVPGGGALVAPEVTKEQLELAKRTVFPDSSNDEFAMFLHECARRAVHPLDRMLYPQKRKGKLVFVTSIDWFRSKAESSGSYAGNDDPVPAYDEKGGLVSCAVTVWKIVGGVRCSFTATARWSEYYPGKEQGWMWEKMPVLMLGKCAEALALRKAFPTILGGVYTGDEMEQADRPSSEAPQKSSTAASKPTTQTGSTAASSKPPAAAQTSATSSTPKSTMGSPSEKSGAPPAKGPKVTSLGVITACEKRYNSNGKCYVVLRIVDEKNEAWGGSSYRNSVIDAGAVAAAKVVDYADPKNPVVVVDHGDRKIVCQIEWVQDGKYRVVDAVKEMGGQREAEPDAEAPPPES